MGSDRLEGLLEVLDLEEIEREGTFCRFRGRCEPHLHGHIFGGQFLAQALVAAARTVEARAAHSLHGYFLRRGDASQPIDYEVRCIRDGASFSNRDVVAVQGGEALFQLSASFQGEQQGYEHAEPMPEVPAPETLPTHAEIVDAYRDRFPPDTAGWAANRRAFDLRHVKVPSYLGGDISDGPNYAWFRTFGEVGDDATLHQALIAYATDMAFNDNAIRPHGRNGRLGSQTMASLDHSLWLHEPARADDWLLFVQESPKAGRGRGLVTGRLHDRSGRMVASVAQETLLRPQAS